MADSETSTKRRRPGGAWNADIEFLLCQGQAMLGPRGASAAVVNQLERGGPAVGSSSVRELCDDEQLGWGKWKGRSSIARYRVLEVIWLALPKVHQDTLVAYYRTTEGQRAAEEGDKPETLETAGLPRSVRNELGQLAGVAYLHVPPEHWPALCAACLVLDRVSFGKRRTELVQQAKRRDEASALALAAVTAAHDAWDVLRRTLGPTTARAALAEKVSTRVAARMDREAAVEKFRREYDL